MKKIIITTPSKNKKWKVSMFGSIGKNYSSPNRLKKAILNHISRLELKEKMSIRVKEGRDTINESLASNEKEYLNYVLSCFLEEFSPGNTISGRNQPC